MKNGKTIFLFVCAFLIIGAILIGEINFETMATDSGFDTGYSGGGGYSGGSSRGSSHSSSSSGFSADPDSIDIIFYICFIVGFFGSAIAGIRGKDRLLSPLAITAFSGFFLLIEKAMITTPFLIWNIISGIILTPLWIYIAIKIRKAFKEFEKSANIDKFLNAFEVTEENKVVLDQGYQIYLDVQNAWMNFDYDKLRELVTDELFHMYQTQLQTLEIKNQKNVMKKFKRKKYALVSSKIENGITTTEMILKVSFYDYIVDQDNHILRGTDTRKVTMTYKFTFVSGDAPSKCPNCGADIEEGGTICPYCNTKIITPLRDMRLAKKEVLKQE